MTDDEPKRAEISTVPPPEGDEDLYNASTKVGRASDELLAVLRSADAAMFSSQKALRDDLAKGERDAAQGLPPVLVPTPVAVPSSNENARALTDAPRAVHRVTGSGVPPVLAILIVFGAAALLLAALVR